MNTINLDTFHATTQSNQMPTYQLPSTKAPHPLHTTRHTHWTQATNLNPKHSPRPSLIEVRMQNMNVSLWILTLQILFHLSIRESNASAFVFDQRYSSRPPQLCKNVNKLVKVLCKAQSKDECNLEPSVPPMPIVSKERGKKIGESKSEHPENDPVFDSLDVVLERARKRKMVLLPIQIQSIANKPLVKLGTFAYLSIGECALLLIAIKLESYGFSLGYVVGKGTTPYLRRKFSTDSSMAAFVELWSGGLAIFSDVIWNNVF